jgi:excisionase family DNA binding protein
MSGLDGWINTTEAAALTGYTQAYMRRLARTGQIEARKVGRDWLVKRDEVLAHKQRMDRLGPEKHSPWRKDLASDGRGRRD